MSIFWSRTARATRLKQSRHSRRAGGARRFPSRSLTPLPRNVAPLSQATGALSGAMSQLPTVRCPNFLHNSVRSIHLGQYLQDARAIDSHRPVFGPIHISVPAPRQVAVENKPDQLRVLVEQRRARVSSYHLVGCRNVQRQIQIELVLCLDPRYRERKRVSSCASDKGAADCGNERPNSIVLQRSLGLAKRQT